MGLLASFLSILAGDLLVKVRCSENRSQTNERTFVECGISIPARLPKEPPEVMCM